MAISLSIIFVSFIFSTSVSFGEDVCSHYEDNDCIHPNILKNGHFVNQWTVYLPGMTKDQARELLENNGFDYLGQIMDGVDLHLVTKHGTPEKHALPNEKIIELLKKHEKVHSVAQKHVLENSQEQVVNIINEDRVYFEPLDPNMIILNDGRNNLERIAAFEATEAASTAAEFDNNNDKLVDTNETIKADDDSRKKKQSGKKHGSVFSLENKIPLNSLDPNNSVEIDMSNKGSLADKEKFNEKSSSEVLDEDALNEESLEKESSDKTKTGING
ncbi:uncharacterized protein LOC112592535 [Melanaphis sacchari]|uniref:uncharacterized protein LOC112592535 n=1 Tax=Melanaphis sacchari TaxID=742174 RepID=UPI000DC12E17|nr:uncharacterized protein LOC112592535 [Melanaphis sacchari]XP_025192406.1 uncharacterized protein LOC112592535 [Melanaphis sacchari]XP_025192407.1 uncharacterized protein LOC112592535 [Melanaphis sacchari]